MPMNALNGRYTGAVAIAFSLILTAVLVDDMHHIEENSMTFNGLPGQVGEKTITIPVRETWLTKQLRQRFHSEIIRRLGYFSVRFCQ